MVKSDAIEIDVQKMRRQVKQFGVRSGRDGRTISFPTPLENRNIL
jgi:hypothetical protein